MAITTTYTNAQMGKRPGSWLADVKFMVDLPDLEDGYSEESLETIEEMFSQLEEALKNLLEEKLGSTNITLYVER